MEAQSYTFGARDGVEIFGYKWEPENVSSAKGVFQLVHGSLEHVLRYEHVIHKLLDSGYIVYANDIRGHGKTAMRSGVFSYFSDQPRGWELAIDDLRTVTERIQTECTGLPVFIFGHSMGSLMVRDYVGQHGSVLRGALITGTGRAKPALLYSGLIIAKLFALFGKKRRSSLLHYFIYGALNRSIQNPATAYDFLSRDAHEVQKYIDDPLCGRTATVDYAHEMARGLIRASRSTTYDTTPKDLSIFLFSGSADPVGGRDGKYVKEVAEEYRRSGISDVTTKLYPHARHELLNEVNKEEVIAYMIHWMDSHLPAHRKVPGESA